MGVDYFECESCNLGFRDDSDYCIWCECGCGFCSIQCGRVQNCLENYIEGEDDESQDRYRGDRIDLDKPVTCIICRAEKYTTYTLFQALLDHFNLTKEQAIDIWRAQNKK